MKRVFRTLLPSVALVAALSCTTTQAASDERMSIYELPNSRLHVFQTADNLGDVSFIVEGEKSVVILEQPPFYADIESFNKYVESLNKPIKAVVANYHQGGLSGYNDKLIYMPEAMIPFGKSEMAQGIMNKFKGIFGEAVDMESYGKVKSFKVPSTQKWADIEFKIVAGASNDFPAASIQIDNDAYYTHFAPAKSHANPMKIKSAEDIDIALAELAQIKASGAKYIFGSHGAPATMEEVEFQIDYYNTMKRLLTECKSSALFGQKLLVSYPTISGAENIRTIAKSLYPNEVLSEDEVALAARVQDYFDMVSNLDMKVAKGLWANSDNISITTPRSQFFGFKGITEDFLTKAFSNLSYRKLSSFSELINVYGDSANVQLYWKFDTRTADGEEHQTRGRETLVFAKINGKWMLTHVHYSRMPQ